MGNIICAAAIALLFGFLAGTIAMDQQWQKRTAEHGVAQYCPQTGDWAWLNECVKGKK